MVVHQHAAADQDVRAEERVEQRALQEHVAGHGRQGVRGHQQVFGADGPEEADEADAVERHGHGQEAQGERQDAEDVDGQPRDEVVAPDQRGVVVADDAGLVHEGGAALQEDVHQEEAGGEAVERDGEGRDGVQQPVDQHEPGADGARLQEADREPEEVPDLRMESGVWADRRGR